MKNAKKNQEMKVYGRHACLTLFAKRPEDVIRVYTTQEGVFEFKQIIRHCVDHKLAYHLVTPEEIEAVTKAVHHEGIALIVKTRKMPSLSEVLEGPGRKLIIALEEVENPHNLGAIMRTAAHFGVSAILYEAKVPVASSASAIRTAEGGAETVPALHLDKWGDVFDKAKKLGYQFLATSSHEGESLYKTKFPEKTILFLGAEKEGLSPTMMKKMTGLLSIPGTGEVESLNVSTATAALLTEWYRQGL
jgi:RNA methyltransferase, TrmH family